MARCGCGGGQCACSVIAGPGVTVDGSGSVANPYIISTEVTCDQVRPCFTAGDGASYDPSTGVIGARPSTDAGNELEYGSDGGLMVPPSEVTCDDVRPCISAGPGASYDPETGVIEADLSEDAGNNLVIGGDGGLYVPAGSATVTTGCGLTGDGSAAAPVTAATGTWEYEGCDVDTAAGQVYCDSAGVLRSEPRSTATFVQDHVEQFYPDLPVPAGDDNVMETRTLDLVNPDPCREAFVIVERELDVDFDLPPGVGAAVGQDTDEMSFTRNTGSSQINDSHIHSTKVYHVTIPPGGTTTVTCPVTMGRGNGGATYNRIQTFLRAWIFNL